MSTFAGNKQLGRAHREKKINGASHFPQQLVLGRQEQGQEGASGAAKLAILCEQQGKGLLILTAYNRNYSWNKMQPVKVSKSLKIPGKTRV